MLAVNHLFPPFPPKLVLVHPWAFIINIFITLFHIYVLPDKAFGISTVKVKSLFIYLRRKTNFCTTNKIYLMSRI